MFRHLPIAMIATLSPVAVSDAVPTFDIVKECRFESQWPDGVSTDVVTTTAFDRCSRDEVDARERLQQKWTQFVAADKSTCLIETNVGGLPSYVELLTCLELANDLHGDTTSSKKVAPKPIDRGPSETAVGDRHDSDIALKQKAD